VGSKQVFRFLGECHPQGVMCVQGVDFLISGSAVLSNLACNPAGNVEDKMRLVRNFGMVRYVQANHRKSGM
jgi:hypothetical protein